MKKGSKEHKAQQQIKELLAKEGLEMRYKLDFPMYRILPDELQLALKVLEKHKMGIKITIEPQKQ